MASQSQGGTSPNIAMEPGTDWRMGQRKKALLTRPDYRQEEMPGTEGEGVMCGRETDSPTCHPAALLSLHSRSDPGAWRRCGLQAP